MIKTKFCIYLSLLIVCLGNDELFAQQQTLLRPTISSGTSINNGFKATVGEAIVSSGGCLRVGSQPGIINGQSCTVETNNPGKKINISVFPNPTAEKLYLNIDLESEMSLKAELVDFLGHVVYEKSGFSLGMNELIFSQIPAGAYDLLIKDKQGIIRFNKLIIKTN